MTAIKTGRSEDGGRTGHLGFLDGVRGVAALYVVLHHIWLAAYPGDPAAPGCHICLAAPAWTGWLSWGHLAVAVFIVVSGFSLALSPLGRGDRLGGGFGTYIRRRAFRIIPPYWAALFFSCLLIVAWTGQYSGKIVNAKAVAVHALLLQNLVDSPKPNGAFWSISVEWQIYFAFPVLLLVWRRAGGTAMLGATVLAVIAAYLLGAHVVPLAAILGIEPRWLAPLRKLLDFIPQFLALFAFGVAAAHVLVAQGRVSRWPWTGIGTALALATGALLTQGPTAGIEAHFFWVDLLGGAAAATLLAGFAQRPTGWAARAFASPVPRWLGQSSYSLYLTHAPILEAMYFGLAAPLADAGADARFLWLLALVVPAAIAVSRTFWWAFERPFMKNRSFGELFGELFPRPARRLIPQPQGSEGEAGP